MRTPTALLVAGIAALALLLRWMPANELSLTSAGQSERPRSTSRSGRTSASSPGRRSSASSLTAGPGFTCRIAEITRSVYIAASTTPSATTTE
jgi:hypothetical protein